MAENKENNPDEFRCYVSDPATILVESAGEVKRQRDSANEASTRDFECGRLMAYNEVISLMQQQALAFGFTLKDVGLENIDPDRDFV